MSQTANWELGRRAVLTGVALLCMPEATGAQQPLGPREVALEVARLIGQEYVDEIRGRRAAQLIMSNARHGRYDRLDDDTLAESVSADAQSVLNDEHFGLMAGVMASNPGGGPSRPHQAAHRPTAEDLAFLQADNFGVNTVNVLPGNVGRIAIRAQFYRPIEEVRIRYAAAMTLLADTSALIIDCTDTIGGDPQTVALLASYFFDRAPFVINRFYWRKLPVEEFRTTRDPGGPPYGEWKPLIIALSANSFSAAEEFAYDMQALRRGYVVGERTSGGANHGLPMIVSDRFTLFVPQARASNPLTGRNWEGIGITPDIEASGQDLLRTAHRVALERVIAAFPGDRGERARRARLALGEH